MFILCTYADLGYWRSGIEPLIYPTGCSFYRPFSYQEQWVQQSLLDLFKGDRNNLETSFSNENWNRGVFGLRFKDESHHRTFIPLRWITLTKPPEVSDKVHLRFRLGDYIQLSPQQTLQHIDLSTIVSSGPENTLMAEIPPDNEGLFTSLSHHSDFPAGLWEKLATDTLLPEIAKQNFRNTTVLRLVKVTEGSDSSLLATKNLQPSHTHSTEYGYELWKDKQYDFVLAYNRIYTPEESQQPLLNDFQFNSRTELYDVSRIRLPITGNYREETLWVMPKLGQKGAAFLEWIGVRKTDIGMIPITGEDKILGIQIPVKNFSPAWPTERWRDLIVGSILLAIALILFYIAVVLSAQAQSADLNHEQTITILIALGAGVSSFASTFLTDAIKGKY